MEKILWNRNYLLNDSSLTELGDSKNRESDSITAFCSQKNEIKSIMVTNKTLMNQESWNIFGTWHDKHPFPKLPCEQINSKSKKSKGSRSVSGKMNSSLQMGKNSYVQRDEGIIYHADMS